MPRLPFLFFYVIGLVLLLIAAPAHACSFDRLSPLQLFARASTVFVAHVVRTEEAMGLSPLSDKPEVIVEASFRIVEVLKGQPPKDGKVKSRVPLGGNCSIELLSMAANILMVQFPPNYVRLPTFTSSLTRLLIVH